MSVLRGTALTARARELSIPGRSRMSADELRAAIDAVSAPVPPQVPIVQVKINTVKGGCPITGATDCASRQCELHYMSAPLRLAPFRTRNGKRKPSRTRTHRKNR